MKKFILLILCLFIFPLYAFASGGVTVDKSNVSMYVGGSASFNINANNAAGKVTISSSNSSVATVNKTSEWVENSSLGVSINGKSVGSATITVVVDAATFDQEVIKTTYTINVNVKAKEIDGRDTDNTLKTLEISNVDIDFNKSTTSYSAKVGYDIENINITALATSSKATVYGTGSFNLNVYNNSFDVKVVAENQTSRIYHIEIIRADKNGNYKKLSNDNLINNLLIKDVELEFNTFTTNYNLKVENSISKLEFDISLNNEFAKYEINDTNLKEGPNVVKITVTSESGLVNKYTFNVYRKSSKKTLSIKNIDEISSLSDNEVIIENDYESNQTLDASRLNKIKESKKIVNVETYKDNMLLYSWKIDGSKLKSENEINTEIKFEGSDETDVNKLLNYAKNKYLDFTYSGDLPEGTEVSIYVGDEYEDGTVLNFIYYNKKTNKLELYNEGLVVENGFINVLLKHCSTYVLTEASVLSSGSNNSATLPIIVSIIEFLVIFALIFYIFKNMLARR